MLLPLGVMAGRCVGSDRPGCRCQRMAPPECGRAWVETYPWLALLCYLVFTDNVVSRMEGRPHAEPWLRSGEWQLIGVSLGLVI